MRIKSYFAPTVEEAMALARNELGPDAIFVNTRKAPPEARRAGEYEVVFASEAPAELPAKPESAASWPAAISGAGGERLSADVAELKRELEGMRKAFTRTAFAPAHWAGANVELSDVYSLLVASEVAPELAREVAQAAIERAGAPASRGARGPKPDGDTLMRAAAEELEARVLIEPALGKGESTPRIAALVGPPGSGKTTTLVKLAVNYGLAPRRPAFILTMDTYRVAAAEQLRSYAAILGVGFHVLETVASLSQAIEEHRSKELILIDTPGFGFGEREDAAPLASFLAGRNDIDTQLVLPCSMKATDLSRMAMLFEPFRPDRLIFTKLDETDSFGPVFNEAARSGKPLSFFATGQRIPEDIEAAGRGRVSDLVLNGGRRRAASAA